MSTPTPRSTGRLFGFDNHVFLDSLRQLGFVVPAVHSNYCHTFLSVPSMLNAAHIVGLSDELGRRSVDRTVTDYLVRHNRTVPFLKSQGYRYALFPTLGWEATKDDPRADIEFHTRHGWDPAREVRRSGLRQVLDKTSLLKFVRLGTDRLSRDHVTRTLAGIAQVPKMPGARIHVRACDEPTRSVRLRPGLRTGVSEGRWQPAQHEAAAYIEQIQCLNRMVLDLVTTVLRTSELPPVILLQGDHGSKTLLPYKDRTPDNITIAAGKERLGAFGRTTCRTTGARCLGTA